MYQQQTSVLFTHYLKYFGTLLYSCQSYSHFMHMNSCYSRHSLWYLQTLLQEIKNAMSVVHPFRIHDSPPIRPGSTSRFSKVFISGLLRQRLHFKRNLPDTTNKDLSINVHSSSCDRRQVTKGRILHVSPATEQLFTSDSAFRL